MKEKYTLSLSIKLSILRYLYIYIPLILLCVFSSRWNALLIISGIFLPTAFMLIFIERFNSDIFINDGRLIQRRFFRRFAVPLSDVRALNAGYAKGLIAAPETIEIIYKIDGVYSTRKLIRRMYDNKDIVKFIQSLHKVAPEIEIDRNIC